MILSRWLLFACLLVGIPAMVAADDIEDAYQQRAAALPANNADAHYELGRWCNENGLSQQAHDEFEKAIAIDPDHLHARHLLGYERVDGKWYKGADAQIAKGLVSYHGQWVTKEFAENSDKGLVLYQGKWITLEERYKAKGYVKYHGTWVSKERMHAIEATQAKARERIRLNSDWANALVQLSKQQHFLFKSNISLDVLNEFSTGMEQFYQALSQLFNPREMDKAILVEIYANREQFLNAAHADGIVAAEGYLGYFRPDTKSIRTFYVGSVEATLMVLYHECTHLLIHTSSNGVIPRWLDEGMAVLFESSQRTERGINLQTIPYERLWHLNEMFKDSPVDLNKLCNIVDGREYTVEYYPQGWSMVYFLLYGEKGKNRQAFSDFFSSLDIHGQPKSGDEQFKLAFQHYPEDFKSEVVEFFKNIKPKTSSELVSATRSAFERFGDFVSARIFAQRALDSAKEPTAAALLCNARLFLALGRWHAGHAEAPEDYQESMDFFSKYFSPTDKSNKSSIKYTVNYGNERLDYARACIGAGHYEQAQEIIDDLLSRKEFQYDGDAYSCLALLAASAIDPTYHDLEVAKENVAIADDLGAYHENKYVHGLIELQENSKDKAVAYFTEAAARDVMGFSGRIYRREVRRLTRDALKSSLKSISGERARTSHDVADDDEEPPIKMISP